jgi:hypothetical protein
MNDDQVVKAADKARTLLRNRSDVSSVGVSRGQDGDFCVRVDVSPQADKERIQRLLARIGVPVIVRAVTGILRAH